MIISFKNKVLYGVFVFLILLFVLPGINPPGEQRQKTLLSHVASADRDVKSDELFLTVLYTADEHSAFIPHTSVTDYRKDKVNPARGGFARLAGLLGQIRAEKSKQGEPVVLVSGGDFISKTPFAWLGLYGFAPELDLMQQMGYDAVTLGNHEFDYGPEQLADYLRIAGYPGSHDKTAVLGSNTAIPEGHPLHEAEIKSIFIKQHENGLKTGYFGLNGNEALGISDLADPVTFSDPLEAAEKSVAELRQLGADLIICLTHGGENENRELAAAVPDIDLIVGGHTHEQMDEPVKKGKTFIVQAGPYAEALGILELAYNPENEELRIRNGDTGQGYFIDIDSSIPVDEAIEASVDNYTVSLNKLITELTGGRYTNIYEPVVYSRFPLVSEPRSEETPFGNFVTDAIRFTAEEKTGKRVDFAFITSGQIQHTAYPGSMDYSRGALAFYDIAEQLVLYRGPDGGPTYPVASTYLTGNEIRQLLELSVLIREEMSAGEFFEISGVRINYDPRRAILFRLPFVDLPIPTFRALTSAELYTGEGIQSHQDEDYVSLKWNNRELYHVATDYMLLEFLPIAVDMLPLLKITPKDEYGNPVKNTKDLIIYEEGRELKVWQAVLDYATALPVGSYGLPEIPVYYESTSERITEVRTIPLLTWLLALPAILASIIIIRRRRQKLQYRHNKTV